MYSYSLLCPGREEGGIFLVNMYNVFCVYITLFFNLEKMHIHMEMKTQCNPYNL